MEKKGRENSKPGSEWAQNWVWNQKWFRNQNQFRIRIPVLGTIFGTRKQVLSQNRIRIQIHPVENGCSYGPSSDPTHLQP